jgi:hypothetical protein
MKNNNKLYCTGCKKLTKHTPKLSAFMDGYMVCGKCSKMNSFCTLIKVGDESFQKHSKDVRWVEFNEDGRGKELRDKIIVGSSLIMSPFSFTFTWMTTIVTEIIEEHDNYVHFKTENSEYKLYYNPQDVQESN